MIFSHWPPTLFGHFTIRTHYSRVKFFETRKLSPESCRHHLEIIKILNMCWNAEFGIMLLFVFALFLCLLLPSFWSYWMLWDFCLFSGFRLIMFCYRLMLVLSIVIEFNIVIARITLNWKIFLKFSNDCLSLILPILLNNLNLHLRNRLQILI